MSDNDIPSTTLDLTGAAASYSIPRGDVAHVMRRGRRLGARRRRATAAVITVMIMGAGLTFREALGTDEPGEIPLAAGGSLHRGDPGIAWRVATPDVGLGFGSSVTGGGPVYALSTAAGERDYDKARRNGVVWRSDDGVNWVAASTLAGDLYAADLASTEGRVFTVGTSPAITAAPGRTVSNLLAGWSDDGGKSFSHAALPDLDLVSIAERTTRSGVTSASIATGPRGTIIVVTVHAELDVRRLLPDLAAPNGWATTATGVDILGDGRRGCANAERQVEEITGGAAPGDLSAFRCYEGEDKVPTLTAQDVFGVEASYTFDQLGVDDDLLRVVKREPIVYFAPSGSTEFERITPSSLPPVGAPVVVEANDEGFDVIAPSADDRVDARRLLVLHSDDGRTFSSSAPVPAISWVTAVGKVRGVTTIVGGGERGAVVAQRVAGEWRARELASAIDPAALDRRQVHVVAAGIGDFGVVAAVLLVDERSEASATRIVASRDGTTWSDEPLEDLIDGPVRAVHRVVVTGQRAVVTVGVGPANRTGQGPLPQRALIGVAT